MGIKAPPLQGAKASPSERFLASSQTCSHIILRSPQYDDDPGKWVKLYESEWRGTRWKCDVAYERFLGPEIFFNPEICNADYTTRVEGPFPYHVQARAVRLFPQTWEWGIALRFGVLVCAVRATNTARCRQKIDPHA